jgi:hypothetical protein
MAQTVEEPESTSQASVTPEAPVSQARPAVAPQTRHTPDARERPRDAGGSRRTRVVIRKVGPLSVLKVSLIFYFCVMLVVFLGLIFLYSIMGAIGAIDKIQHALSQFNGGTAYTINTSWLFQRIFVAGCAMVVVWSLINVIVSFLYNLISDIVGGVEITLAEKR